MNSDQIGFALRDESEKQARALTAQWENVNSTHALLCSLAAKRLFVLAALDGETWNRLIAAAKGEKP